MAPRSSSYRIVISGNIVEAFEYTRPIGYDLQSSRVQTKYRARRTLKKQEITKSSLSRSKNRLIRLINANVRMWHLDGRVAQPQFLTYTFAKNITDVAIANPMFTNYIKRLNYHTFGAKASIIKYVAVPEFQKRGAVHYHAVFFNLPMINARREHKTGEFADLWKHGFIKKKNVSDVPNIGIYMTKYMTKDANDRRLVGRKKYFSTRGLFKPVVVSYKHIARDMMKYLHQLTPVHTYQTKITADNYVENPTKCATYNLNPDQLSELKSFYTV